MEQTEVKVNTPIVPSIDVEAIRSKSVADEQSRIGDILDYAGAFNLPIDAARSYVREGKSLNDFRKWAQENPQRATPKIDAGSTPVGLSEKEVQQYSFLNAIRSAESGKNCFEREVSQEIEKIAGKSARGIYIPFDKLTAKRDMQKAGSGGNLIQTSVLASSFIDILRAKLVIQSLGAQYIGGLVGDITLPRKSATSIASWVAEAGTVTKTDQTFNQVPFTPHTILAATQIDRKMMKQASLDVETLVINDLAAVLALGIDNAAINGSGASGQPKGIMNVSGIGSVAGGTNGLAATFANVVALETAVAAMNADVNSLAYLTNAKVRGSLKGIQKGTNLGMIWDGSNTPVNGYNVGVTNNVLANGVKGTGTNLSTMIFGNFNDLIIASWGALDLLVDPYTASNQGAIIVNVFQDVDVNVRHPESFAAITDIIA